MKNKGFVPNFAKTIEKDYPEKTKPSARLGLIYAKKLIKNRVFRPVGRAAEVPCTGRGF